MAEPDGRLSAIVRLEKPRSVDWFDAFIGYVAAGQIAPHVYRMLDSRLREGPSMAWPFVGHACDVLVPLFWYVVLRRRFPIGTLQWRQLRPWVPYWIVALVVASCSIGAALLLGLRSQLGDTIDLSIGGLAFLPFGPIGEEFLWRGLIQSGLNETLPFRLRILRFEIGLGTLITAACFGIVHMGNAASQPYPVTCLQAASAFVGGLVLGIGYERTRNIWGAILCHIVNNATATALIVFVTR
jgi:membrane protease YdiL (CAAX protease family)